MTGEAIYRISHCEKYIISYVWMSKFMDVTLNARMNENTALLNGATGNKAKNYRVNQE